jgi:bifunctional non-homologous end joining protein LigD
LVQWVGIAAGTVLLLTRTGLDWRDKYTLTAAALKQLPIREAYIDDGLCVVGANGVTSFGFLQAASDNRTTAALVYFAFDLLYVDGKNLMTAPLIKRKWRLRSLLSKAGRPVLSVDHQLGKRPLFYQHACRIKLEGIASKRIDAPYKPSDRGLWVKTKCLNREEFVIVGWTDPEGSRPQRRSPVRRQTGSRLAVSTPIRGRSEPCSANMCGIGRADI